MAAPNTRFTNVEITGNLSVGGSSIVNNEIDDDLTVTGDVAVETDLDVAGDTTLVGLTLTGVLALAAGGFTMAAIARTATAAGLTTGTIASGPMLQFIAVTAGADANSIIILPAPTPGSIVILHVGGTGYELRTSDPATIGINGGTGATAESAIGANTTVIMICASATSWKGLQLGSDGTLAQVEAAA